LPFLGLADAALLLLLLRLLPRFGQAAGLHQPGLVLLPDAHPRGPPRDDRKVGATEYVTDPSPPPIRSPVLQETTGALAGGARESEPALDQRRQQVVGQPGRAGRRVGMRIGLDDEIAILAATEQAVELAGLMGVPRV